MTAQNPAQYISSPPPSSRFDTAAQGSLGCRYGSLAPRAAGRGGVLFPFFFCSARDTFYIIAFLYISCLSCVMLLRMSASCSRICGKGRGSQVSGGRFTQCAQKKKKQRKSQQQSRKHQYLLNPRHVILRGSVVPPLHLRVVLEHVKVRLVLAQGSNGTSRLRVPCL